MTPLLLSVTLKGLLVVLLAALASRLLRKAPASARHGVWAAAFAALLLLPALALVGPQWAVVVLPAQLATAPLAPPVPPTPPTPPTPLAPPAALAPAASAVDRVALEAQVAAFEGEMRAFEAEVAAFEQHVEAEVAGEMAAFEHEMEAFAAERAALDANAAMAGAPLPPGLYAPRALPPLGRWALALWALGAFAVALSWVGATLAARRIVADAAPETDPEWGVLAERARRLSGVEGPVRLLRTDALDVPIAWGWGTPAVLLPASADDWDEGRREAVLLHEMAHLRRRDAWTQAVAQAALAVHWLNPLAWWGYRRFLDTREQACDDAVIQGGARPSDYAAHLVGVARALRREPHALAAVAPMARTACPLEDRVRSILDAERRRGHVGRAARAATVGLAAAVLLPLAALQPVAQTAPTPATAPVTAEVVVVAPALTPAPVVAPAPVAADTTDEEALRRRAEAEADAEIDRARRDLRQAITEVEAETGEPARLRALALREAHAALGEIHVGDLHREARRALDAAQAGLAEIDSAELRREIERAIEEAEHGDGDVDLEQMNRDLRRSLEAMERGWNGVDADALRRDIRRSLEAAEAGLAEAELSAREHEAARRALREARREIERSLRDAEADRRDARPRQNEGAHAPNRWTPVPAPKPAPRPAAAAGPSAPPSVGMRILPRAAAPGAAPRVKVIKVVRSAGECPEAA